MKAAEELKQKGAKNISVFCTHGLFNGNFYQNLENATISKVYVTDSVAIQDESLEEGSKVVRIPTSKVIADSIFEIFGKN